MKKILAAGIIVLAFLTSCNGANDGNPKTDTTAMPADTNMNKDTVHHINRADGTVRTDTPKGADTLRGR